MSTSWSAKMIVGIEASEVYTEELVTVTVTKYNPDTGHPYETQAHQLVRTFAGKPLPPLSPRPPERRESMEKFDRDFSSFLPKDLELYMPFYREDHNLGDTIKEEGIFGVVVKNGGVWADRWHGEISEEALRSATLEAKQLLAAAGYKGVVKTYIMLLVG